MRTLRDLLELMIALNTLTERYGKKEITRDEYISKFDEIVKAYEAIK